MCALIPSCQLSFDTPTTPAESYFQSRLNHAVNFMLSGRPCGRELDSAFEMYDGDEMATAIVRRARANPQLDQIIRERFSSAEVDWYKIATLRDDLTDTELEQEADQVRRIEGALFNLLLRPMNVFIYGPGIRYSADGHRFVDALHDYEHCEKCFSEANQQ